jgi:release factor glutamine methyltransferase
MIELLPAQARRYEPWVALDGGPDGLGLQRRVATAAPQWLAPDGRLLIETSQHQLPQTVDILARIGLSTRVARCELLEATVVTGST